MMGKPTEYPLVILYSYIQNGAFTIDLPFQHIEFPDLFVH